MDAETGEALGGVPFDLWLLEDGNVIGFAIGDASRHASFRTPALILTAADGSFARVITNGERRKSILCEALAPSTPAPGEPDQIRISVSRLGCQQTLLVDLNEDTVADPTFADGLIELKDPVFVPVCEEEQE